MILLSHDGPISTVTLNRPEKHNAFNMDMLSQLHETFVSLKKNLTTRVVLLRANGKHFCAGADIQWLQQAATETEETNKQDTLKLASLLHTLATFPRPIIAIAQGRVLGGGIGLLCCADFVIATPDTHCAFSEAKLGLIPATIAPYVIRRMGFDAANRFSLTTIPMDAQRAQSLGLLHEVIDAEQLETHIETLAHTLLQNSPQALTEIKALMNYLYPIDETIQKGTAEFLARVRIHPETQARSEERRVGKEC